MDLCVDTVSRLFQEGQEVFAVSGGLEKSGGKYNHRDRPFAVLVSVRDFVCDTEDIVNALYGDDAITYAIDQPGSVQAIRK